MVTLNREEPKAKQAKRPIATEIIETLNEQSAELKSFSHTPTKSLSCHSDFSGLSLHSLDGTVTKSGSTLGVQE